MNSAMTSDILISNCLIDSLVRDQIRDDECLKCTSKAADTVPSEVTVESKSEREHRRHANERGEVPTLQYVRRIASSGVKRSQHGV